MTNPIFFPKDSQTSTICKEIVISLLKVSLFVTKISSQKTTKKRNKKETFYFVTKTDKNEKETFLVMKPSSWKKKRKKDSLVLVYTICARARYWRMSAGGPISPWSIDHRTHAKCHVSSSQMHFWIPSYRPISPIAHFLDDRTSYCMNDRTIIGSMICTWSGLEDMDLTSDRLRDERSETKRPRGRHVSKGEMNFQKKG